jgi:hypothetical protein
MTLTKVRAGYYDYNQYSLIKEESGWWTVYEWNTDHTESTFVCSADRLRFAKTQLRMFIEQRVGV